MFRRNKDLNGNKVFERGRMEIRPFSCHRRLIDKVHKKRLIIYNLMCIMVNYIERDKLSGGIPARKN